MDPRELRRDPARSTSATPASAALLAERLHFTRISARDLELLAGLRPTFERAADRFVDDFYAHLQSSAVLRELLADPALVARLKLSQREYMLSLTSGRYDQAYVERRLAIGRAHARIGLAPQWYLGAYSLYHDLLVPLVHAHHASDPHTATRAAAALAKLLVLDMQIVLDAYYESRERQAIEHSQQLAAVGEMAASVAHEVRNPLAGMRGALEIVRRDTQLEPDTRSVLDEVVGQIERLEGLVRDLLDFAAPQPLARVSFDLQELLERLLRACGKRAAAAGITIERLCATTASPVVADPQQLEQVFLNLVHNALQAMEAGGKLTVRTVDERGGTTVTLSDTGKGIPPHVLPQVFQSFFTTKHRGSGLGLSIVRKILDAHGGTIELDSAPGRGTTVTVHLPRMAAER